MARELLVEFYGWPPSGANLNFVEHQNFVTEVIDRIEPLLTTWTSTANQVLVVNDGATGPVPISSAAAARFANKPVRAFKPYYVVSSSSVVLTDDAHGGCILAMENASAATVTINITGNPATGISTPFRCEVERAGAGAVQVVFTGVTNVNPNGHTRIQANRGALITLRGTTVRFDGYTEA